jgi:hypothetical protein
MLARVELDGYTVIADTGFAGAEFEQTIAAMSARFLRPDRPNEPRRHGSSGAVRQRIGSVFWTCKGQLTLKQQGRPYNQRALHPLRAQAARARGNPGRHFAGYGY